MLALIKLARLGSSLDDELLTDHCLRTAILHVQVLKEGPDL